MIGIYFSGTGNSKHCCEYLVKRLDNDSACLSIEDDGVIDTIKNSSKIVFAYPVYYSNLPKIVHDFIVDNATLWCGKQILIVATMALFSGDGAGCAARLFKKYKATVLGGLHLKMPDCIGDVKVLKKSLPMNQQIVKQSERKMDMVATEISTGKYPQDGLRFFNRLAGLLGQRLYFRKKNKHYYTKIKTNHEHCVQCGLCVKLCPMKNITLQDGKVVYKDQCTMCYRCFAHCPHQAITILGKKIYEQSRFDKYQ